MRSQRSKKSNRQENAAAPVEAVQERKVVPLDLSVFQMFRLDYTPRCLMTPYQFELENVLRKATKRLSRELDCATLVKRVRKSDNFVRGFTLNEDYFDRAVTKLFFKDQHNTIVDPVVDYETSFKKDY